MGCQRECAGTNMIEELESRRLLDATLVNGVITVTTEAGIDDIIIVSIDQASPTNIVVAINDSTPAEGPVG